MTQDPTVGQAAGQSALVDVNASAGTGAYLPAINQAAGESSAHLLESYSETMQAVNSENKMQKQAVLPEQFNNYPMSIKMGV